MFTFGEWQCGITEAADILRCTKRTLQNYYHPEKRDPVKWHYLELHATRRILPEGMWFDNDTLHTDTGFSFPAYELKQWSFFQSAKDSELLALKNEIKQLKRELQTLRENTRPAPRRDNVINFPTFNHGDKTA